MGTVGTSRIANILFRLYKSPGQIIVSTGRLTARVISGTVGQVPTVQSDGTIEFATPSGGGGGGAVTSVNGEVGVVVLTALEIAETATRKWLTDVGESAIADGVSHRSNTSNPHSVSAAQVGADASGTAAAAVSTHAGQADPHPGYTLESREGAANGVATLDATGNVPVSELGNVSNAVDSVNGLTGAVVLDASNLDETATRKWLSDTERSEIAANTLKTGISSGQASDITTNNAKFSQSSDIVVLQVGVIPGETVSPDVDIFAPFDGTLEVSRYVLEGVAPSVSTALVTVTNERDSDLIVSAQDAVSGITSSPTALAVTGNNDVLSGDMITTEVVMSATIEPALNSSGVVQSRIGLRYTFTRS